MDQLIDPALEGYPVAWFSPTFPMMTEIWREVRNLLQPVTSRISAQEKRIELITGGIVDFWSLDAADSTRGRKYKRVVLDEAAMVRNLDVAWNEAIRPTLTDYKGDAWFLSTPKGMNFFWQAFTYGQDPNQPDWASFQMPTTANPYIDPEEVEAARRQLPERVYLQEFLAQFIEEAGGVFRRVRDAIDVGRSETEPPKPGAYYSLGVDVARINDFTVIDVIDADRRQVYHERFNQISWERIINAVERVAGIYNHAAIWMDSTGVGDPPFEALYKKGLNVTGYQFTNASKTALMDELALTLENGRIRLMDVPVQTNELLAYQYELTPSRNVRMNAPCFIPGTLIQKTDGCFSPIEALECNDAVITHIGEEHTVTTTMVRDYEGPVLEFKVSGLPHPLTVTPEHPFWAKKRTCRYLQRRESRKAFPSEWVEAKDLKTGDWLAVPKRQGLKLTPYSEEQLYALGFWLAEGHILRGWAKDIRGIGLTNTEPAYLERVSAVLTEWFDRDWVYRGNEKGTYTKDIPSTVSFNRKERPNSQAIYEWLLYSRDAGHFFARHLGEGSSEKRLSEDLFKTAGLLPLIAGFIDGDGSQRSNAARDVNIFTTSETLAWQMRQILIDNGIWATLAYQQRKPFVNSRDGRECLNPKRMHVLNIKASFLHLLPKCKVEVPNSRHLRHVMEDDSYFYTPIRQITSRDYSGPIHNLAVEGDNSYVAGGVAVHNCGMHDDCVVALALANWGMQGGPAAASLIEIEDDYFAASGSVNPWA